MRGTLYIEPEASAERWVVQLKRRHTWLDDVVVKQDARLAGRNPLLVLDGGLLSDA